jgi:hypothetical protein
MTVLGSNVLHARCLPLPPFANNALDCMQEKASV